MKSIDKKELMNPSKKYRPVPFWSWNEKLDPEETRRQIREMEQAGLGGYFMHARGGLQTPYMSKEWFDNVFAACEEGEKLGMQSWGYDENGWPSGFGSGTVNALGEKYQQKYLRLTITDHPVQTNHTIINLAKNGTNYHFYYEVNPFYVDVLDREVIARFLESTYDKYFDTMKDQFGKLRGFFTDEPQISRKGFPWSLGLERAYVERYGESLTEHLLSLYFDDGEYRKVRYQYWALVRDLFSKNYMGQIEAWCHDHNSALTGHVLLEENYADQILANGSCMASYEYMTIPGMDWLRRKFADIITEMQVSSVANQLGRKQILSETFALCGWNVSLDDLRNIYEHQMVHGINLLCQHLEGYSIRGCRKRDYPASLYVQQPWWKEYKAFNDYVSRIGYLVSEGDVRADVLLLNNIESAWTSFVDVPTCSEYTPMDKAPADQWSDKLRSTMEVLENRQIQYHLGDDSILRNHASVSGNRFLVGTQSYETVIVSESETISDYTLRLLKKFSENGGNVLMINRAPEFVNGVPSDQISSLCGKIVSNEELISSLHPSACKISVVSDDSSDTPINCLIRYFRDKTVYYLHNRSDCKRRVKLRFSGASASIFDPQSGEEKAIGYTSESGVLSASCSLLPRSSAIFFVSDHVSPSAIIEKKKKSECINGKLEGEWEIVSDEDNLLTLDYCDAYFDGVCAGKGIPVIDVQEMALAFRRKVKTDLVFHFTVQDNSFDRIRLILETPEIFTVLLNGRQIPNHVVGTIHDKSFHLIDIAPYVLAGENEIRLSCDFVQSEEVYQMADHSKIFESERNKLYYDMELDAIYLAGNFGVESLSEYRSSANRGLITDGPFVLTKANRKLSCGEIASQGYPFFSGSMILKKSIFLNAKECKSAKIAFSKPCAIVTKIWVNGKEAGKILWPPYELDVSAFCREGENEVRIELIGSLRNMLGPLHLEEGECFSVSPRHFQHNSKIWPRGPKTFWSDSYCFVEFGLFF